MQRYSVCVYVCGVCVCVCVCGVCVCVCVCVWCVVPPQNMTVELCDTEPALMLPHTVSSILFFPENRYTTNGFSLWVDKELPHLS